MSYRRPVCVWLLAFLAYSCLGIAWALALPVNGHTDEHAHIIRAYAVATGQVLGPKTISWNGFAGSEFRVPGNLLPPNDDCLYAPSRQDASCLLPRTDDSAPVPTSTWTGRYSPVYYGLAGLPLRFFPDDRGLILARIITSLLTAALLASALAIALTRNRFAVALGVVLAMTPTMVALSGAVNPNAIEAASAALLFVSLLTLSRARTAPVMALATISGVLLITTRTLGPVFFALILAAAFVANGRRRELLSAIRWPSLVWASALAAAFTWNALSGATSLGTAHEVFDGSFAFALQSIVEHRLTDWLTQLIAVFGYTETFVPAIIVTVWWCAVAVFAARSGLRLPVVAAAVAIPVVLTGLELSYLWQLGFSQNGRYVFPLWIVLLVLAGFGYAHGVSKALARTCVAIVVTGQLWSLAEVMTRFQHGPGHVISPFGGDWQPASGPLTPLALAALGAALLIALFAIWLRPVQPRVLPQASATYERDLRVSV